MCYDTYVGKFKDGQIFSVCIICGIMIMLLYVYFQHYTLRKAEQETISRCQTVCVLARISFSALHIIQYALQETNPTSCADVLNILNSAWEFFEVMFFAHHKNVFCFKNVCSLHSVPHILPQTTF